MTAGSVMHKRGHDYRDLGFTMVGRLEPIGEAQQHALADRPSACSNWVAWQDYLERQDAALEGGNESGRSLFRRRR